MHIQMPHVKSLYLIRDTPVFKYTQLFKPNQSLDFSLYFFLYIERIFVGFSAGIADYSQEKSNKKKPIENKKTAENMNTQNI